MAEYVKVAAAEDIPVGQMKAVTIGHVKIAVCHLENGFYAIADECSHDYAPISTGRVRGDEVVCPRHGARFDIRSGKVAAAPAVADIDTYKTKVEDGQVYVLMD